jgi:hypothetical protein
MRKTKTKRKISKFTNKNRLAGMLAGMYPIQYNETGERHVFGILTDITRSLISADTQNMEIIKRDIILLITKFKVLSTQYKITFVEKVSRDFNQYHHLNPILIELYYMQIMILIDATLHINWLQPRTALLAKLSNDTMQMIAAKFAMNVMTPDKSLSSGIPASSSSALRLQIPTNASDQLP